MSTSQTWYINQISGGSNRFWYDLSSEAAALTQTTSAGGNIFTVGKTAAGNYADYSNGGTVASGSFGTTILPNTTAPTVTTTFPSVAVYTPPTLLVAATSITTLYTYNGYFPAGTWTFNYPVIAGVSGGAADGRMGLRVFKAINNGTTFGTTTELTAARLVGTTVTNLTTTAAQTSTITWSAPIVRLNNELLVIKLAWEITGAGGASNSNIVMRYGQGATMVSPSFRARTYNIT